jgi:TolA-binding protein
MCKGSTPPAAPPSKPLAGNRVPGGNGSPWSTVGRMESERVKVEMLRPAADRLRLALRRMDEEDVPAALRPLAASSARRLPPPLLARAIQELDGSEWLRSETVAEGGLPEDSPASLFVVRPDGWEAALERHVAEMVDRQGRDRVAELEERLRMALGRVEELEAELGTSSDAVAAAERKARRRLIDQIESSDRARRRAEQQARDEATSHAAARARAERLEAEMVSTESRMESLRRMLERERRASADVAEQRPSRGWFPSDPSEMADELDRIVTAVRRPPAEAAVGATGAAEPAASPGRFPEGIRPDRPEAIRWLIRAPRTWLVDGYNVAFQLDDQPDPATRSRVVAAVGRLVSLAAGGTMGVVVFDSSGDVGSLSSDRRVRVVFVHSADDWILDHAGSGAAVVTSDRRVREGAEGSGAFGVWSEALAGWMASGGAA